jgi:hypothetical protein
VSAREVHANAREGFLEVALQERRDRPNQRFNFHAAQKGLEFDHGI